MSPDLLDTAPLIVFTDLDGTLLDHNTYDWRPATAALDALRSKEIPLVLVSSKTMAEMQVYREQLQLNHPVVAENGASIWCPEGYFKADSQISLSSEVTRLDIQKVYSAIKRKHSFDCEAFFELGVDGIKRETGLSDAQARNANTRTASEPVRWRDSASRAEVFAQEVRHHGLTSVWGGRFLHVMPKVSKATAVTALLDVFAQTGDQHSLTSVSLGDGPNDIGMFNATSIAVIIPGHHSHPMALDDHPRVIHAPAPGPEGWNEVILDILAAQPDNQKQD